MNTYKKYLNEAGPESAVAKKAAVALDKTGNLLIQLLSKTKDNEVKKAIEKFLSTTGSLHSKIVVSYKL